MQKNRVVILAIITVICLFTVPIISQIELTGALTGRVIDAKTGAPLIGANVYLVNTTKGAATDNDGKFTILDVPMGSYLLTASYIGYEHWTVKAHIPRADVFNFDFKLDPIETFTDEVVVEAEAPKDWKKRLKTFTREFLGNDDFANECTIENPEILDFEMNKRKILTASTNRILSVENRALGYRLKIIINDFSAGRGLINYWILPQFELLEPKDDKEHEKWYKNRDEAYLGSLRHFLSSLAGFKLEAEGFEVFTTDGLPPDDYMTLPAKEKEIVFKGSYSFEYLLQFRDFLKIVYLPDITKTQKLMYVPGATGSVQRSIMKQEENIPVSWLLLKGKYLSFDKKGIMMNPYDLEQIGTWPISRISYLLPREYAPPGDVNYQKSY